MEKAFRNSDRAQEIVELKKRLGAVILAHNYQPPEVQDVADFVGDSLELSIKASQVNAKFIVFCGVDFMAEQAAVINEESIVLHPDPKAMCPMAAMISVEDIHEARKQHPKAPVVIYVNSPAAVKAEADYIVTSANAVDVVKAIDSDTILFGPDKHLAEYVAEKTGKKVIPVPEYGYCPIHVKFNADEVMMLKSIYRDCVFIAHPECPRNVRDLANFVGSTSQMIKFVKNNPDKCFLIGTEVGIIHRMIEENRDKLFIPASTSAICKNMKKITLDKVYNSLKSEAYRVSVNREIAAKVRRALENTFSILGVEPPWLRK
jgi:quinolinate synthase